MSLNSSGSACASSFHSRSSHQKTCLSSSRSSWKAESLDCLPSSSSPSPPADRRSPRVPSEAGLLRRAASKRVHSHRAASWSTRLRESIHPRPRPLASFFSVVVVLRPWSRTTPAQVAEYSMDQCLLMVDGQMAVPLHHVERLVAQHIGNLQQRCPGLRQVTRARVP